MNRISQLIEAITVVVGRAAALLLPLLMLCILLNVTLRYVFQIGLIELEELQWHINAVVVMCCLAWAYQRDVHVRVDAFHAKMHPRTKALVELFGVVFLLFPFLWLVASSAWVIFGYSWQLKEGSPMPSGLPARYVVKFVMAAGLSLLLLQGVAIALRSLLSLMNTQPGVK